MQTNKNQNKNKQNNKNQKNTYIVVHNKKKNNFENSSSNKMIKFADQIDELEMLAYKNTEKSGSYSSNEQKYNTAYNLSQQNSADVQTLFDLLDANTTNISTNAGNISALQTAMAGKQNNLTAGANISISGNTISATNTTYSAGNGIDISGTTILADTTVLATKTDLQSKQNTLTAGENITIQNNVISSTASGGNVDTSQIESDILALKNGMTTHSAEINNLKGLLLLALENINGADQTFDQTLTHTFEEYDRELELVEETQISCPNVVMFCRDDLTQTDTQTNEVNQAVFNGLVSATIQYQISAATTCTFQLFDSGNVVASATKTLAASNIGQTLNITLRAQQGFSSSRHNYYVVATTSAANALTITHQNVQIVAPEPNIVNKISPIDVSFNYYTNKYYFSDCSSGTAMIAEVDANNFTSVSNIVWTNTGIAAQSYKTCFIGATDNTTSEIGKKYAIITLKTNTVKIFDCDNPAISYTFPVGTHSVSAPPTKRNYILLYYLCTVQNSTSGYYYCLNDDCTYKKKNALDYLSYIANLEANRNNAAYLAYSASYLSNYSVYKTGEGHLNLSYISTTNYGVMSNIAKYHLYLKSVSGTYTIIFEFYLLYKQQNKFYMRQIRHNGTGTTFTTPVLIGEYDDVFLGKNNNTLFAVENGTLLYLGTI